MDEKYKKNVMVIVRDYLRSIGVDGLWCIDCMCSIEELMPCERPHYYCIPATNVVCVNCSNKTLAPFREENWICCECGKMVFDDERADDWLDLGL